MADTVSGGEEKKGIKKSGRTMKWKRKKAGKTQLKKG